MDPSFTFDDDGVEPGPRSSKQVKRDPRGSPQAPWEFSRASEALELELFQSKATSIDHKIEQRLHARGKKLANDNPSRKAGEWEDEEGGSSGSEGRTEDGDKIEKAYSKKRRKDMGSKPKPSGKNFKHANEAESESDEEEDDDDDDGDDEDEIQQEELNADEVLDDDDDDEEVEEDEENDDDDDERYDNDDVDEDGNQIGNDEENEKLESKRNGKPESQVSNKKKKISKEDNSQSFFSSAENVSFTKHFFSELNLSRPLIRACEALGYKKPTPIQSACIPLALSGRDVSASAVTGSGKTAAFSLPILERLLYRPKRVSATRVLILTPTRELAVQIHSMIQKLAQFTDIRICLVVGGLSNKLQESALRTKPDIVVATPGRMIDHLRNAMSVHLDDLSILVLDEADRLLEMGFSQEVKEIVKTCPFNRQTLLFSATMTDEVSDLIKLSLKNPVRISADAKSQRPMSLTEEVVKVKSNQEGDKEAMVLSLCTRTFKTKTIIFCGMKVEAHRLKIIFGFSGLKASELHGNLTQTMRLEALESFRKQESDFLIATDVAARGLDISGVETIINLECPKDINTYVHRVGRTARAGKRGTAITFISENNRALLKQIMKRAGNKIQSRTISPESIKKFRLKIEEMEDDIRAVSHQEYEEKLMRKAEMEASKAQNMMDHADEIYSKPPKTWFQTKKEKKALNDVIKDQKFGNKEVKEDKKMLTIKEAEEKKMKEKRKLEKEKSLPRRKRRRLEQERERAREEAREKRMKRNEDGTEERNESAKSKKKFISDEEGLRLAKKAKALEKRRVAGKIPNLKDRSGKPTKVNRKYKSSSTIELPDKPLDILGADGDKMVKVKKSNVPLRGALKRKPGVSKRQFKSKSRYKRKR